MPPTAIALDPESVAPETLGPTGAESVPPRIERAFSLATATIVFVLTVLPFAVLRPLTNDEIYSFRVAIQPSFSAIWSSLLIGADNHPPLDYWVRHASMALFGAESWALRLPSLLAVWLAMACIYRLVARSLGNRFAFGASLLFLIAAGHEAALQTRGYAFMLCAFGVSVSSWNAVIAGHAGWTGRLMFIGGLLLAVYSHYYGVLHGLAFFLAALTASKGHLSRAREPIILIGAAALLSLPLIPLVEVASQFSDRFWTPVTLTSLLTFYPSLLTPLIPCVIAMSLMLILVPRAVERGSTGPGLPRGTLHALVWFSVMPIALFAIARLATGAFWPRYSNASAAALSVIAVALAAQVRADASRIGLIAAVVPLLFLVVPVTRQVSGLRTHQFRVAFIANLEALQRREPVPVVIGDDGLFVEVSHGDVTERLRNTYFVYDAFPDRTNNVDKAIKGLLKIWPIRAMAFAGFTSRWREFRYIGNWGDRVLERARADGAHIEFQHDPSRLDYWRVVF